MKYFFFLASLGVVLALSFFVSRDVVAPTQIPPQTHEDREGMKKNTLMIHTTTVELELARTKDERARGLMDRTTLGENSGMLFLFDTKGVQSFWNERTLLPLDVIWIDGNVVVGISSLPPITDGLKIINSTVPVDRVLEVNRGWSVLHNINVGDTVTYSLDQN